MTDYGQPVVGIGVMLWRDGQVLLGKRRGSHGAGFYAYPGGKLDHLESLEECARRETREETGLEITNVRFLRLLNYKEHAPRHFLDIALLADALPGEPQVREPAKVAGWDWYHPEQLPVPLFRAAVNAFLALKTGQIYWDA